MLMLKGSTLIVNEGFTFGMVGQSYSLSTQASPTYPLYSVSVYAATRQTTFIYIAYMLLLNCLNHYNNTSRINAFCSRGGGTMYPSYASCATGIKENWHEIQATSTAKLASTSSEYAHNRQLITCLLHNMSLQYVNGLPLSTLQHNQYSVLLMTERVDS